MSLLFYGVGATNGYNADGHYVRVAPVVGACTAYARTPVAGCSANFSWRRPRRRRRIRGGRGTQAVGGHGGVSAATVRRDRAKGARRRPAPPSAWAACSATSPGAATDAPPASQ